MIKNILQTPVKLYSRPVCQAFSYTHEPTMKNEVQTSDEFNQLRIYKQFKTTHLLNLMFCNHILRYEFLVKNSENIYYKSQRVFGRSLVNFTINQTVGKVYTGADKLENAFQLKNDLASKNVGLIINYCDEASGQATENSMDVTTQNFKESIEVSQKVGGSTGLKFSGLCDINTMKKINKTRVQMKNYFRVINDKNETSISGQQLFDGLVNKFNINISEQQFLEFATQILRKDSPKSLNDFSVSRVQWETLVNPFYINFELNNNEVIKSMVSYTESDIEKAQNFVKRLDILFETANKSPEARQYVDAEQSYIQDCIEQFANQYQLIYNKQEPMVYSTIQCYLKDAHDKMEMEIAKSKEFGLIFGAKLVKGAYLNEEAQLKAKKNLQDSYDDTTDCYTKVALLAIENAGDKNEVLMGIHNVTNVEQIKEYMEGKEIDHNRIRFAQLLGMGDYLTYSLSATGYNTCKYVPFGKTDIMIPYLCRRAYEGFKFLSNVKKQEELIKDELKKRFSLQ